ncbi:MAG: acyl-CoA/acyl-ACP dehydrogenase [Beijerinckiaceae bacterium]|nr:acyl-CoA/acyl-ACP dehydrogenase [Beijerinckiaceae bacterium]
MNDIGVSSLHARARAIGVGVAAAHADAVDREGRFPFETFEALKAERLLGAMIPLAQGGEGASFADICDVCCVLGQHCASSAMIYAMHQIQVICLIDCASSSAWHQAFLARAARDQLLLASSTSEAGIGGDFRNSVCAIEASGTQFHLRKEAIVISYGTQADCILVTARRNPDAPSSDQVIAVIERAQYSLKRTTGWDTLGMRGVCSEGHIVEVTAACEQIAPEPFAEIAAQSMLGASHLVWASMWFGIASSAIAKAQSFVKAEARKRAGAPGGNAATPAGIRLAHIVSKSQMLKARIMEGIRHFEAVRRDADGLTSLSFTIAMNNLKISASETMLEIITEAMMICGIYGYKNDTPHSLGRLLRDALSAPIMINNDRILGNTSNLLTMYRQDATLTG